MDFAAVADIHAMKRQIHAFKGHGEIAVEGHNIKLGRGGIREIEFFVQTQQLIAGGRHPELRGRGTLATLGALAEGGWISGKARDELEEAYLFLRAIEHRLQMVADEQTHTLPAESRPGSNASRSFAALPAGRNFADALVARLQKVQHHYSVLFEPSGVSPQPNLIFSERFRRPRRRSIASRSWASATRWKSPRPSAAGWPAAIRLARRIRARAA